MLGGGAILVGALARGRGRQLNILKLPQHTNSILINILKQKLIN